jgi:hypothetical protein
MSLAVATDERVLSLRANRTRDRTRDRNNVDNGTWELVKYCFRVKGGERVEAAHTRSHAYVIGWMSQRLVRCLEFAMRLQSS